MTPTVKAKIAKVVEDTAAGLKANNVNLLNEKAAHRRAASRHHEHDAW